jgi:hypothetical protein
MDAIRTTAPFADFSDPAWVRIDAPGTNLEINIPTQDPLESFAFHIHDGDGSAGLVSDVLQRLNLRAFDHASESGIFDPALANESFHRSQHYRSQVLESRDA